MLVNIKQTIYSYSIPLGVVSIFFLVGCTNQILYHPPKIEKKLSDAFYHKTLEINTTNEVILSSVLYRSPERIENKGTILFLHGNADNITTVHSSLLLFVKRGYDILLLDYRGYGKSTGSPSPQGLHDDIVSTIEYLTKDESIKNLYIYGQSIGGTSLLGALDHINKSKIKAILTEGSFLSYKQLSSDMGISIPFTNYEELRSYAPISSNPLSTIPLMLIHSDKDEIIPYSQGLALSKHFINAKHIKITGKHLRYLSTLSSFNHVLGFFEKNKEYQHILVPVIKKLSSIDNNQTNTKDNNVSLNSNNSIQKLISNDSNTSELNITNTIEQKDNNLSKGELNV